MWSHVQDPAFEAALLRASEEHGNEEIEVIEATVRVYFKTMRIKAKMMAKEKEYLRYCLKLKSL